MTNCPQTCAKTDGTMRVMVNLGLLLILLFGWEMDCAHADEISEATAVFDYFSAGESLQSATWLRDVDAYHTTQVMKYVRENNLTRALAELNYTLRHFPNHPQGLLFAELVSGLSKAPGIAVTYYEKAVSMYPNQALTQAQFGRYLASLGKVDEGVERLKGAIKMNSKMAAAHAWLAEVYYHKGDRKMAAESIKQARALGFTGDFPFVESTNQSGDLR